MSARDFRTRGPSFRYLAIGWLRTRGHVFASPPADNTLIDLCCDQLHVPRTAMKSANKRRLHRELLKLAQAPP